MTGKTKAPARGYGGQAPQTPQKNPLPQSDSRWQRTVRYGWDKGGARGGRK